MTKTPSSQCILLSSMDLLHIFYILYKTRRNLQRHMNEKIYPEIWGFGLQLQRSWVNWANNTKNWGFSGAGCPIHDSIHLGKILRVVLITSRVSLILVSKQVSIGFELELSSLWNIWVLQVLHQPSREFYSILLICFVNFHTVFFLIFSFLIHFLLKIIC